MLKNLKNLRGSKKLSQKQMAEAIGISQQSISKYENNNAEPDIAKLQKIADFFDVSIDYLVGNTEVEHKAVETSEYLLTDNEVKVMENFRTLKPDEKGLIGQTINALKAK